MSIPQRIYVYLAAFVAFYILLQGAYSLAVDVARSRDSFAIEVDLDATWIAMIIVGLPVWLAHEFLLRRAANRHPEEAGSALRKIYVHASLAVASLYVFFGCIRIIEDIAGDSDGVEYIGGVLIAAVLWYYFWRRENREGQPTPRAQTVRRWRIYGLSVIFLTATVTAVYWITYNVAYAAYNLVFDTADTLISGEDFPGPLRIATGWALVGIIAWAVQWRAVAIRDEGSVLRQVYLYGFAFIGGASLALWGVSLTIYVVITKFVGADDTTTTVAYFRQFILPGVGLLIGLILLAYHWSIIRRDAARRLILSRFVLTLDSPVQAGHQPHLSNTFKYIMSAVGLIAFVPGLMGLLVTILTLLTEGDLLTTAAETETLSVSLTMIVVGAPLWFAFWWRSIRADPRSLVRRIYLYVTLIALGGTFLITLTTLIAAALTAILGQGSGFLDETLIPGLSIILPTAVLFAYHVLTLYDDSRRMPAYEPPTPEPPSLSPEDVRRLLEQELPVPTFPSQSPDDSTSLPTESGSPIPAHYIIPAPPYVIPAKSILRPE